jgi:hypothetical protein
MRHFVDATFRIASVADDVAEAQGLIDGGAIAEHRLQRVPVGMDVGEDRDPQAGLS